MRLAAILCVLGFVWVVAAADVESRVLTHYVPQDFLESVVRKEGWTELPLNVKGGLRKDDVVRIWAGGSIDWANGDQPGENISNACGLPTPVPGIELRRLALSPEPNQAFALLFKTEAPGIKKCLHAGKPLEIKLDRDKEKIWIGFNDLRGHYQDNHLGKGRRHEFDPLWVRIEVVRIIVD
jgi:hypothetical protein